MVAMCHAEQIIQLTPLLEIAWPSDASAFEQPCLLDGMVLIWFVWFGLIGVSQLHLNLSPSGLVCSFPASWQRYSLADKWLQ